MRTVNISAGYDGRPQSLVGRIDFIVIAAPPAMTIQWKDEFEAKFGLSFEIIDRERISEMRRRGVQDTTCQIKS